MFVDHKEEKDVPGKRTTRLPWLFSAAKYHAYPERRSEDRRSITTPINFPNRRQVTERRSVPRRKRKFRISIFVKLASLVTALIFLIISTIGLLTLQQQKKQFIRQLTNLGESLVRIASKNAPDKLLAEEDLALFQLLNDIVENENVEFAIITDHNNIIKAHSRIEAIDTPYSPPNPLRFIREEKGVKTGSIVFEGEETLFFEATITYQKVKIGKVYLAVSQKEILRNINKAKIFILVLTLVVTLVGIILSLGLSMYFSYPLQKLNESIRALGSGKFGQRVSMNRNDEFGDLAYVFNRMAEDLDIKEKIKGSFGRYVTPEIVEMILANPDNQWMKGSEVEATVLFVDIRGFTSLAEDKEPSRIIEFLNDYFTLVTDVVIDNGGHINKFLGDEVMIVFGTPVPCLQHADDALKAALEIQERISQFDKEMATQDLTIQVGIGINSGAMVAGNLGSEKRMEYTVIGDNVNVASRLTSLAKPGEILISKQTNDLIRNKNGSRIEERGKVIVKGRKGETTVFSVSGLETDLYEDGMKEAG